MDFKKKEPIGLGMIKKCGSKNEVANIIYNICVEAIKVQINFLQFCVPNCVDTSFGFRGCFVQSPIVIL
jgi:hypothetical protein